MFVFRSLIDARTPGKAPHDCRKNEWKGPPLTSRRQKLLFVENFAQGTDNVLSDMTQIRSPYIGSCPNEFHHAVHGNA